MSEKIVDFLDKVTLPLKYKVILAFGTGVLLVLPRSWTTSVLGFELDGPARMAVGIVFVVFGSFSVIEILLNGIGKIANGVKGRIAHALREKKAVNTFLALSDKEKEYIALFQLERSISVAMPVNDGIVISLELKGLITRAGIIGVGGVKFDFTISPALWKHLVRHPEILDPVVKRIIEKRSSF